MRRARGGLRFSACVSSRGGCDPPTGHLRPLRKCRGELLDVVVVSGRKALASGPDFLDDLVHASTSSSPSAAGSSSSGCFPFTRFAALFAARLPRLGAAGVAGGPRRRRSFQEPWELRSLNGPFNGWRMPLPASGPLPATATPTGRADAGLIVCDPWAAVSHRGKPKGKSVRRTAPELPRGLGFLHRHCGGPRHQRSREHCALHEPTLKALLPGLSVGDALEGLSHP